MKNIKWGCIQPLTGGMYIGAEYAIKHPASWVISYPGLTATKEINNNIVDAGNEYNLLKWCESRKEIPPYMVFNRKPFDAFDNTKVELIRDEKWSTVEPNFENTDLVISVPVCSGLSQATIAKDETKDARNNNMLFNATYTLENIKPTAYIFENAPGLVGNNGAPIRKMLNELGENYGYSVGYFKTNTLFHNNCQNRIRTFVVFLKWRGKDKGFPSFNKIYERVSIKDYFSQISKNAKQNDITYTMTEENKLLIEYFKHKFGNNWRNKSSLCTIDNIINNNLYDDAIEFIENNAETDHAKNKLVKYIKHVREKIEQNLGIYSMTPICLTENMDYVPACTFKTIPALLHYEEDRLLTVREWLHLMGLPEDFILYGDINRTYAKIGQNVPVNTAKYIVSEACRFIENFDTIERNNFGEYIFDNTRVTNKKMLNTKKLF